MGRRFIVKHDNHDKLLRWRYAVTEKAQELWGDTAPLDVATSVSIQFWLPRPGSITQKKRPHPIKKPDLDKLIRAILDALTDASVLGDDAQVVHLVAHKFYGDDHPTGAQIDVWPTTENP